MKAKIFQKRIKEGVYLKKYRYGRRIQLQTQTDTRGGKALSDKQQIFSVGGKGQ
jgi:hypothetical protein